MVIDAAVIYVRWIKVGQSPIGVIDRFAAARAQDIGFDDAVDGLAEAA